MSWDLTPTHTPTFFFLGIWRTRRRDRHGRQALHGTGHRSRNTKFLKKNEILCCKLKLKVLLRVFCGFTVGHRFLTISQFETPKNLVLKNETTLWKFFKEFRFEIKIVFRDEKNAIGLNCPWQSAIHGFEIQLLKTKPLFHFMTWLARKSVRRDRTGKRHAALTARN